MKKEHLFSVTKKDFIIQTFRSGGKGGQHQNKTDTGVRIKHPDSGAVGECRETASQHRNKKLAFSRLTNSYTFTRWLNLKISEAILDKTVEQEVDEQMDSEYIKTEIKENGKWVTVDENTGGST